MRTLLRSLHDRLRVRGWVSLCVVVVAVASIPSLMGSRFVREHRAEIALERARRHVAAHEFEQARVQFRNALRLQPDNPVGHSALAAMELSQGNSDVAALEYELQTELHPEDAAAWIQLADLMEKSGLLEAPEALLDRAIAVDPKRADARSMRGNIRLRLGRYYGALQDARAGTEAAPKDVASWLLRVRCEARSKGTEAGIEAAHQALSALGADATLQSTLAALLAERGRKADTEMVAPDLGPPIAPPRRLRADAQGGRGNLDSWTREHWPGQLAEVRQALETQLKRRDWTEAQRIVDSAESTYHGTAFPSFLSGVLELARGNLDEAERRLLQALKIAPRLPAIVAALGRTWSLKKGTLFAGERLMLLATQDPGLSTARYMAARAFIEARDPVRAEAALTRGLVLQPDSPVPYQQLTDFYFGVDRAAEALDVCRRGLERFPQDTDLQMMLAQLEVGVGQPQKAIQVYENLVSQAPAADLAQYKLATLLAAQPDEASRQRFRSIVDALRGDVPSDPGLLDALGWMNYQTQDVRRARALLEAAAQGAPEEPSIRYHLAVVYVQDHETTLARQELRAALDSPRPFSERIEALRLLRQEDLPPPAKSKVNVTARTN